MATCPMCSADVDETEMDDHKTSVHADENPSADNDEDASSMDDEKAA